MNRGDVERDAEGAVEVGVTRFHVGGPENASDAVACEEPLEIQLGGASLAVVKRTPGYDEELALGFLVTERVISSVRCVESVRHCTIAQSPESAGNVIRVRSNVLSGMVDALTPVQSVFARTGG